MTSRRYIMQRRNLKFVERFRHVFSLGSRSCGFRLHEADAHLGYARLAIAQENPAEAREHLAAARKIIHETEYHRRDGEVLELENALAQLEASASAARSR